jgi:hypothetical protein
LEPIAARSSLPPAGSPSRLHLAKIGFQRVVRLRKQSRTIGRSRLRTHTSQDRRSARGVVTTARRPVPGRSRVEPERIAEEPKCFGMAVATHAQQGELHLFAGVFADARTGEGRLQALFRRLLDLALLDLVFGEGAQVVHLRQATHTLLEELPRFRRPPLQAQGRAERQPRQMRYLVAEIGAIGADFVDAGTGFEQAQQDLLDGRRGAHSRQLSAQAARLPMG